MRENFSFISLGILTEFLILGKVLYDLLSFDGDSVIVLHF